MGTWEGNWKKLVWEGKGSVSVQWLAIILAEFS